MNPQRTDGPGKTGPGFGWEERYLDGSEAAEAAFLERAVSDIHIVMERNKKKAGAKALDRAFHAKIHAGIQNAELVICDDVPSQLQGGFLQPGKRYRTAVRFSNAAGTIQPDAKKDLRGLALEVETDEGPQDFLGTNGSANHARNSKQFMAFAKAMSGAKLLILFRLIFTLGLRETVRMFRTVIGQVSKAVVSLAEETYFSRSAFSFGGCAARFQLTAAESDESVSVEQSENYLREDLIERLKRGPVVFNFQVQLFINEKVTPIEDGSAEWLGTPFTIAKLIIPQQDLTSTEALAAQAAVQNIEFTPWKTTQFVRPLGSLNRARRPVYSAGQALRKGRADGAGGEKPRKCPFHWRPKSKREGISAGKYVYWNAFYYFLQALNVGLARDKNRKVSWDKWPPFLGVFYLLAKIRFNRSNALTDPYDYATNDTKEFGPVPESARHEIAPDGSYVSDNENPQMGTPNTRFGSNIPAKKVRPDVEQMTPSAREAGKLRWRKIDPETGKEITVWAMILNDMAGWWIQFQFHGFGGNTKRDPVGVCPHMLARDPKEGWPGNVAVVDRTSRDTTRLTDNGRPTVINERVVAWIQGQFYGTSGEELGRLRAYEGGKFRMDGNGHLPPDPSKPGVDLTGFNNNYGPGLSFLHWLFVMEHNAICDHYAYFHPDWDDEKLFQMARKVNVAQVARIHTIQWTEDLLQHPTLQLGMHADWYGFMGQRLKMYLTRLGHRYPRIGRLLTPLRNSDVLWGMPGSKWEHHDGPFQLPKHFRMVYRLHEMVLGEQEIVEPGSNKLLERIQLIDFVHHNTRAVVEKYGYETLAWSFVRKSAGALTLHNVTRTLTQFNNMQDGTLTDICERDLFRERTDATGTFNEFRVSLGERPVTSFLELTGGDVELARELEIKYEGDVDRVDAGIGILAEPKPAGFALGFLQFYQFVLNAPRRVKSNRHLTEGFTYAEYAEGMDWVEHGGGMLGAMARHLPALRPNMEGVKRAFSPWPETETFPQRVLTNTHELTAKVFKSDARTVAIGAVTAAVAVCTGAVSPLTAGLLLAAVTIIPACLTVKRMLAMRFLQLVWKKCYTDKRGFMFGTLERAEQSMNTAACFGRAHALAVTIGAALLAVAFVGSHPLVAGLLAVVALSGLRTRKWAAAFADEAQVLKISLRNRMREGQPSLDIKSVAGRTDLERRARMANALRRETGFKDLELRALLSGRYSPTRTYAKVGNPDGIRSGNVDLKELDLMFRQYAPGRDHLTAYDLERMREGNARRDADENRGSWLSRVRGRRLAARHHDELLLHFADRVVEEDKKLVPAISKETLLRFFQGVAQADIYREHTEGDLDPSVVA